MKHFYIFVLLFLSSLSAYSQLSESGFYRVRNAQNTGDYISIANDKFSYQFLFGSSADINYGNAQQVGGGLTNLMNNSNTVKNLLIKGTEVFLKNAIHMNEDADCIDPSTILYLQKISGSYYNIIGQGTSLLTLTTGSYKASVEFIFNDIPATISRESGSGANALYNVSVNIAAADIENISYNSIAFAFGKNMILALSQLGSYYFLDDNGVFSFNSSKSEQKAQWYIEPLAYFNVKAEAEFNGKYYSTICVPFAFTLGDNVLNAFAIKGIGEDGMLETEVVAANGETVPAGTPVLLECSSNVASECKLLLTSEIPVYSPLQEKVQYAPAAATPLNGGQSNLLRGTYFKNEDAPFDYQYNREGTSTTAQITLQHFTAPTNPQKYVIGITESGKLGFVKAEGTAMPANKAWLEYAGTEELWLPFEEEAKPGDVTGDGNVDMADALAIVEIILGQAVEGDEHDYNFKAANVNEDEEGKITIADVVALLSKYILPVSSEETANGPSATFMIDPGI